MDLDVLHSTPSCGVLPAAAIADYSMHGHLQCHVADDFTAVEASVANHRRPSLEEEPLTATGRHNCERTDTVRDASAFGPSKRFNTKFALVRRRRRTPTRGIRQMQLSHAAA